MLHDSYKAKGFKYGIVFSPYMEKSTCNFFDGTYEEQIKLLKDFSLHPAGGIAKFKDLDGLTVREIMKITERKRLDSTLVFVMYSCIKNKSGGTIYGNFYPIYIQCNEENLDKKIDEVIANIMLNNYSDDDEVDYNSRVKCFLQKYIFKSKKKTKAKIKEYKK